MLLASTVLSLVLGTPAPLTLLSAVSPAGWQPEIGDVFVADTRENKGYLIHRDGVYIEFPIATGKRSTVYYIGRMYNATTPTAHWKAKSLHVKGDRITFGKTGEFLRLYKNGTDSTPYGIHGHAYSQRMLADDARFRSMGCVIVSDDVFEVIQRTFELNHSELTVITTYGLENLEQTVARSS